MIHAAVIVRILGLMSALFGVAIGLPWLYAQVTGDATARGLGLAASVAFGLAAILLITAPRDSREISHREGFLIVTLTWCLAAGLGTLPYLFTATTGSVTDAFFEAMSGFTTTGSTVFSALDEMPRPVLLWRSISQWLGGMGMILLSIAILPLLGVGGMQLFKAETPGPVADKIRPRVRDTAARLWGIYLLFTLCESSALIALDVPPFEAVCHSFTTMSTGGFSTHDASIAYYESAAVDAVITTFMLVGGINFVLYFRIASGGWRQIVRESELKFFAALFAAACAATVITLRVHTYDTWREAARYGVFQVASIITTTGYSTADFEAWPFLIQGTLIAVMFTGAMAGSTAGGMKSVRVLLLFKQGFQQLRMLIHPHAVTRVRLSGQTVAPEIMHAIWGFFFLYLITFGITTLALTGQGLDLITASTAVVTALNNVGPGLGNIGPAENFAPLPGATKWLLSLCMLLGRLEIYTVLVLFLPEYWRR